MEQYDFLIEDYIKLQEEFYKNNPDESREILYSMLGNVVRKKVLDLGCGYGKDVFTLTQNGAEVYGIDSSQKMINFAKNKYLLSNFYCQNFENILFENESFDIVFSRFAIQHSEKLDAVFKEIHRILKPRGICVFLVGHPLMQFYLKQNKSYFKSEIVKIHLFDNKLEVQEPSHTFSEYFSDFVLGNFEMLEFREGPCLSKREISLSVNVPDFFVVKMRKR